MVHIHAVTAADAQTWLYLRQLLWPDATERQHQSEIAEFYADSGIEPTAVVLAADTQKQVVGFAELSIRPYAEGCERLVWDPRMLCPRRR